MCVTRAAVVVFVISCVVLVNQAQATLSADAIIISCVTNDYDYKIELRSLEADKNNRLPSTSKGTRFLFVLPDDASKITLNESIRQSRLAEDVSAILGTIGVMEGIVQSPMQQCVLHKQEYKRSTITIDVQDKDKSILKRTMIAGPDEHIYLSADMPVTNVKQLVYDSATQTVHEKEKPASFYIGLNWQLGDIYRDYTGSDFYKNLSFKILVKASSNPSESMGVGLAYSLPYGDIFAASVWTKDEDAVPGNSTDTTQSYIAGISFNISKGLLWLKKSN